MTYQQYKQERQEEFDALPIFFAFGQQQFREQMEKRGLTEEDTDKIYRFGDTGGFYLKSDAGVIKEFFERPDKLPKLMKNYNFAKGAIYYEMCNHEYGINWQRNWDVLNCFSSTELEYLEDDLDESEAVEGYFKQLGWDDKQQQAFWSARSKYFRNAERHNWF